MARRRSKLVGFSVEFEDGTTDTIYIDEYTLNRGDHVAHIIAGEHQQDGKIPNKPIKNVKRVFPRAGSS